MLSVNYFLPNSNLNQTNALDLTTNSQKIQGTEEHVGKQQRDAINKIQDTGNSMGQVAWFPQKKFIATIKNLEDKSVDLKRLRYTFRKFHL